jgi:nucleoside-diphosphate-sugar epimerase
MDRVLIIGGGGYVGTELQKLLVEKNYDVTVYDTFWYSKGKWPVVSFPGADQIKYVQGDVRDLDKLKEAFVDVDHCIHLACISNDPSYELNPNLAKEINFKAFQDLMPIVNSSGLKRFIYASSSSVYGVKAEPNVTEDLSLEPISDYSKYKVACENTLRENLNSDIVSCIIRPSTVCGYSHRQRFDLVVNVLTLNAITKKKILVDGGDQYRPNLHIKDMVNCYLELLKAPSELIDRETFNVAGENLTVTEIAIRVKEVINNGSEIEFLPVRDPRSYRVSGEKIERVLGFRPQYSVDNAISDIHEAFLRGEYLDFNWSEYFNIRRMNELLANSDLMSG